MVLARDDSRSAEDIGLARSAKWLNQEGIDHQEVDSGCTWKALTEGSHRLGRTFTRTRRGNQWILVLSDHFGRTP